MPGYDPDLHHRRSIRLPSHDYSLPGSYFVTVCVEHCAGVLGKVHRETMTLSAAGHSIATELNRISERFPYVSLDAMVIMPNHLHLIVTIAETTAGDTTAPTLGEVIRSFKAASARSVRRNHDASFAWQRNYYERVIRDESERRALYEYIETNPARWAKDEMFTPNGV